MSNTEFNPILGNVSDEDEYIPSSQVVDQTTVVEPKPWGTKSEVNRHPYGHDGKKKRKDRVSYYRRDLTEIDHLVLFYLLKCRYATASQISLMLGVKPKTAMKRLLGLRELGVVDRWELPAVRLLWYIKPKAVAILKLNGIINADTFVPAAAKPTEPPAIDPLGHTLAVNQTISHLLRSDSPHGIFKFGNMSPFERLKLLVSENEIRSTWGAATSGRDGVTRDTQREIAYDILRGAQEKVKNGQVPLSRYVARNPVLWTAIPHPVDAPHAMQFHHPDLVINLEAYRTAESPSPKSIAIEVEKSIKSHRAGVKIMRTYASYLKEGVYSHIVYVYVSETIREDILEYMAEAGLTEKQVRLVPLLGNDFEPFGGKAWKL